MSSSDVSKALKDAFAALPEDQRAVYAEKERKDLERYEEAVKNAPADMDEGADG